MNLKRNDSFFWDNDLNTDTGTDSKPIVRLVFDNPSTPSDSLFGFDLFGLEESKEATSVVKLFPDESDEICFQSAESDLSQPIIRLLPDNPSEEAVLRLRLQLLEAKIARQNAQVKFAERIDVDHLEWRRQQHRIKYLEVGNVLLMVLTFALMIAAGCLAVIR
jgi:hypothetical protein